MSDILCKKCAEPWEIFYVNHEALWDDPGADAPQHLQDAHRGILEADEEVYRINGASLPSDYHYKNGGEALAKAILRGEGCPSCWHDPSRATVTEEGQLEVLRHNLFDSAWDGDPAELF